VLLLICSEICFQTLFPGFFGILLGAGDLGRPIPTFSMEVPRAFSMRLGVDVFFAAEAPLAKKGGAKMS